MKSGQIPARLRAQLLREGQRIAEEQGLTGLLGDDLKILVRFDAVTRMVHYSFRAIDDFSQDGDNRDWFELR